jgi:hypothetical protein
VSAGAAKLLDRLEHVKQTGPGRWIACCPAHEDRSPSLSIREMEDGRLLLYDFGGCHVDAVLAAVGLGLSDLFERPLPHSLPATHSRIPARDLIALLDHEITVAALILADVLAHRTVTAEQWARLATAAGRIGKARDHGRA